MDCKRRGKDDLDAQIQDLGEAEELYPSLPLAHRPSSLSRPTPALETDGSELLVINVIPARNDGGSHLHSSELYINKSMPRGLVFLANYKNFSDNAHPVRQGSEVDVKNLCVLFSQMGYKIPQVHLNLTRRETHNALKEFRNLEEHKNVDSCVVIIMSHGKEEKSFYTSDNESLEINHVLDLFSNCECESLIGKPKIFIFQTCRGKKPDFGVLKQPCAINGRLRRPGILCGVKPALSKYPTYSDMFIVYATVEGFASFRNTERGSWLMEAICKVFMNHSHEEELVSLMKKVSREVRGKESESGYKQAVEYVQKAFDRNFFFNPSPLNSI